MEELTVRVKIAGLHYKIMVEPEAEGFVREAAAQLQLQLEELQGTGLTTQQAMMRIAFDSTVSKLRQEHQIEHLQQMIFDKITQLDKSATQT